MNITPDEVSAWILVGGQLIQVAKGPIGSLINALTGANDVETDNAQLDKVYAAYQGRIQQAQDAADGKN